VEVWYFKCRIQVKQKREGGGTTEGKKGEKRSNHESLGEEKKLKFWELHIKISHRLRVEVLYFECRIQEGEEARKRVRKERRGVIAGGGKKKKFWELHVVSHHFLVGEMKREGKREGTKE
jgi:hypothetical protein